MIGDYWKCARIEDQRRRAKLLDSGQAFRRGIQNGLPSLHIGKKVGEVFAGCGFTVPAIDDIFVKNCGYYG